MSQTVTVVVPIRNEEKHIAACLKSLIAQTYPSDLYEVIVVDGRSSDGSRAVMEEYCRDHANVRVLDNPTGIVPCGMNIGIQSSQADIVVRADGHTVYPPDYVNNCVKYLERTGAENVGGPCLTVPANESFSARLVAAILTNPFGVGDSKFRTGTSEGYVETVPFGAFRRELFDRIGMYNEKLVRNQDNELNARIREAGGKIYQTPALRTEYHPVAGFRKFLKVTFKTSQWHLFSMQENGRAMSARHMIPAMFVLAVTGLFVMSWFSPLALRSLAALLVLYAVCGYAVAALRTRGYGAPLVALFPFASFCFHTSYGMATLVGIRYLIKAPSARPIREGLPTA